MSPWPAAGQPLATGVVWGAWVFSTLLSLLVLGVAGWRLAEAYGVGREAEAAAARAAVAAQAGPDAKATAPADFTAELPVELPAAGLVAERLLGIAGQLGVQVRTLAAARHDASAGSLGRLELQVVLEGPYAGIKRALAQWLHESGEGATVRSMRLQADGGEGGTVQAVLTLALWTRAAPERAVVSVPAAPRPQAR